MATITTYLCNKRLPIGDIASDYRAINISGDTVVAKITTPACSPLENLVRSSVISEEVMSSDQLLFNCIKDLLGNRRFSWARKVQLDSNNDFIGRNTFITLEGNDPDMPCIWHMTRAYGIRDDPFATNLILVRYPSTEGGEIPESKTEACLLSGTFLVENTQTSFVPGELLQLEWAVEINDETYIQVVAGNYFLSPAFTGGKVVSVPEENDPYQKYTIDVQGYVLACRPTDFAAYQLEDWVYLLKQGDTDAKTCDRVSAYGTQSGSFDFEVETGETENEIMRLVNYERAQHGLSSLKPNAKLFTAAFKHSNDMAKNDTYLGHTGSDGSDPAERIIQAGYEYSYAGENVAAGQSTAEGVMDAWMNSLPHRANILSEFYEEIGVSVSYGSDGRPYYTQNFGAPTASEKKDAGDFRLVPMTVNGFGNGSGGFEKLEYDMMSAPAFSRFYETSYHTGKILSFDWAGNTAETEIIDTGSALESQVFSGVPFFYHCRDDNTTDEGHLAFRTGDEVLVLNEGGSCAPLSSDLKIVGFPDRLQDCVLGFLIVSSPSGNEAFVWDPSAREVVIAKDTYDNVLSKLGAVSPPQALPDGEYYRSQYPWSLYKSGGRSSVIITPDEEEAIAGDYTLAIIDHEMLEWRLNIDIRAFGPDGDPGQNEEFNEHREKWEQGNTVVVSTTEGSSSVSLVSIDKAEGAQFDISYLSVDSSKAITQTWYFTFYTKPGGSIVYFYVVGSTKTAADLEDEQYYSIGGSQYPYTPQDFAYSNLESYGFRYGVDRGNYIVKDSKTIAPVLYYYSAGSSSYVPYAKSKFETLTGVSVAGEQLLPQRIKLFYFPLFAWPWSHEGEGISVPLGPWLTHLQNETYLQITQLFDSWQDCDYVDATSAPTTSAAFDLTTGMSEAGQGIGKYCVLYDSYHYESNEGVHETAVHVFFKSPLTSRELLLIERNIFTLVNGERTAAGAGEVFFQLNLQWAAKRHAQDMAENYFYEHTGSDGTGVWDRIEEEGYFDFHNYFIAGARGVTQVIYGTYDANVAAEDVVNSWREEDGSLWADLLTPDYTDMGISMAVRDDGALLFCAVLAVCWDRWAGYSPIPKADIEQYMADNFLWGGAGDESRLPKIHLV